LISQASPGETDAADLLRTAEGLIAGPKENFNDETILDNLEAVTTAVRLVRQEGCQMPEPEEFEGFSEATRQFAKNIKIVQVMEKLFKDEMAVFFDTLNYRLAKLIPGEVCNKTTRGNDGAPLHYWWLGTPEKWDKDVGLLYLVASDSDLIAENRLLVVVSGGSTTDVKTRIRQIKDAKDFNDFEFGGKPNRYSHFTGHLKLPEDDPVGFVAERLAALLTAIKTAEDGK